jgi:hypothetical protein
MEREVTITLYENEARALLPQRGRDQDHQAWNRRMDAAEEAQSKIRAALRDLGPAEIVGQENLL